LQKHKTLGKNQNILIFLASFIDSLACLGVMIQCQRVIIFPCETFKTNILINIFPMEAKVRLYPLGALHVGCLPQTREKEHRLAFDLSVYGLDEDSFVFEPEVID